MATQNRKKFTKSKGKKFNKKDKSADREEIMKDRPGKNDISWYGDSRLIDAAGRLNFTNPLGKPVGWSFDNSGVVTTSISTGGFGPESVPGVMSLYVEPGIGFASNGVDISNVFVRNFYSFIRHANSGHTNYNAPDLGIYIMSVDQIYLIIEHLIRIYGVARTFSSANRYMPTVVLKAMGVDPFASGANLYENLASFRAYLLMLMVKVGTLVIPKDFTFIQRHKDLFRYVYMDGSTPKSQLYVFRPDGYKKFVFQGAGHEGGYLEYTPIEGLKSAWEWLSYADEMIRLVVQDEDMNIMSGDILKAYGPEGVYKWEYFDENYTVIPVYNPEILLEIHNLKIAGRAFTSSYFDIYQDPTLNIIKYEPVFKTNVPSGNISPILDMPVETPTPEQIMIATRLCHMGSVGYDAANDPNMPYKYVPEFIGSEVITQAEIWQFNTDGSGNWIENKVEFYGALFKSSAAGVYQQLSMISKFDWHFGIPIIEMGADHAAKLITYIGEFENYTPANEGDLRKLHEVALIGEFKVPLMGVMEIK